MSPNQVIAIYIAFGLVLTVASDFQNDTKRLMLLPYILFIYAIPVSIWALGNGRQLVQRWAAIIGMVFLIFLGMGQLMAPAFLLLLPLPIVLAVGTLHVTAALIVTVSETLVLFLFWSALGSQVDSLFLPLSLLTIWAVFFASKATLTPIQETLDASLESFNQLQQSLAKAREYNVQKDQLLEELLRAYRQLDLLNERLAAARLIADEAQKAKAAFVANVSHEFRTPLNMIIGLIELVLESYSVGRERLPSSLHEDLSVIYRNSEHLATMVNDVLNLSQAEAGQLVLHREWVDLRTGIASSVEVVRPVLNKKGLAFTLSIPATLPAVYCDPTRIRQVILNLVSNAARFTDAGHISLIVQQLGDFVFIHVTDTGPGIATEDLERIFEPFQQRVTQPDKSTDKNTGKNTGKNADKSEGGTGLGLSISKQFVEYHGGQIWAESRLGEGSTFSFKLPISPLEQPASKPARWLHDDWVWLDRRDRPAVPKLPYRRRLVLADPSGELAARLAYTADRIEVIDRRTIAEAARAVQESPAHALVINAGQAAELWPLLAEAQTRFEDTPVIGFVLPALANHSHSEGVANYLVKPITRAALEKALQSFTPSVRRVLVIDDDPDVRNLLTRMLQVCDPLIEATAVEDGESALALLDHERFDLILLDVMMKAMDGWEFLERKNQSPSLRPIPLLIISAQDPVEQQTRGEYLTVTLKSGISIPKLLYGALQLSSILLKPDPELDQALE